MEEYIKANYEIPEHINNLKHKKNKIVMLFNYNRSKFYNIIIETIDTLAVEIMNLHYDKIYYMSNTTGTILCKFDEKFYTIIKNNYDLILETLLNNELEKYKYFIYQTINDICNNIYNKFMEDFLLETLNYTLTELNHTLSTLRDKLSEKKNKHYAMNNEIITFIKYCLIKKIILYNTIPDKPIKKCFCNIS